MHILFVHQNFPGQFKHLAPALAQQGHTVVALHINACLPMPGVQLVRYQPQGRSGQGTHRWLVDLETKTIRGEAAYHAARQLQQSGFSPGRDRGAPWLGREFVFAAGLARGPPGHLLRIFLPRRRRRCGL